LTQRGVIWILLGKNFSTYDILGEQYHLPYGGDCEHPTEERILMNATILFATRGYEGTTTKIISEASGVTEGAFYRHFSSKKLLWSAVIDHAVQLYKLYHETLGIAVGRAKTFTEAVDTIFEEPMLMRNVFTTFAFALIINEQVRNPLAGQTYCETFLEYTITLHKGWFDSFIDRGLAKKFDSELAAAVFVSTVNMGIVLKVQETLGRNIEYDFTDHLDRVRKHILQIAGF
jgi:AcrR family transcriptional regulator